VEKARTKAKTRRVGIDLGKRTCQAAFVGASGKAAMTNGKTGAQDRQALCKKLRPDDRMTLEAGNMAFVMAKEIEAAAGCKARALNPAQLAVIYRSMKKTDKEDALKLARMLKDCREERLPVAPMPSDEEMRRRKLLSCSRRACRDQTSAINRLRGLFVSHGITTVAKKGLATDARRRRGAGRDRAGGNGAHGGVPGPIRGADSRA